MKSSAVLLAVQNDVFSSALQSSVQWSGSSDSLDLQNEHIGNICRRWTSRVQHFVMGEIEEYTSVAIFFRTILMS